VVGCRARFAHKWNLRRLLERATASHGLIAYNFFIHPQEWDSLTRYALLAILFERLFALNNKKAIA
jgi:hypothetical protein